MNINLKENKTKVISAASTIGILLVAVVICLAFGYDPPDPPIPEEGVEVNVGNSDFGEGNNPEPASTTASYAPPAAQQQVATQHTEPSVAMNSATQRGNVTNPHTTQQPQVENKEPEINSRALFTGRRNQSNGGGSQGNTTGQGNQGNENGNPNSNNYTGAGGGNGVTADVKGRSAVSLPPPPSYKGNDQGKVIVKVWVNQQGQVIRAEGGQKGSTIAKGEFVKRAEEYALKARFNASANAPEEQVGYITYIFKI